MVIISSNKPIITNMDAVQQIIKYPEKKQIIVDFISGHSQILQQYDTEYHAEIAFEILYKKLAENKNVITMPTEQEIRAYITNYKKEEHNRPYHGHKRKGHGGS